MLKLITPGSQDFHMPAVTLIKRSGTGRMVGSDRVHFEKRAGAGILEALDRMQHRPDEVLIHLIAVGSTEKYGCNRNGDGFREAICRQFFPTFEKHARFYRDHANRDPSKSYGLVKAAFFNDTMSRIELICALNATEEAARRNGGLLADRELEKLAKQQDIPTSMACGVSHDICSYCKNAAKTRKYYCKGTDEGGTCKAGGLSRNIGRLVEVDGDLHSLHADNPDPKFFDISHVFRPADRIAYVLGRLEKAAGEEGCVCGAELAETLGIALPYALRIGDDVPKNHAKLLKIAYELADLEKTLPHDNRLLAFHPEVHSGLIEFPSSVAPHRVRVGQWLKAAIDARALLTPAAYLHGICRISVKEALAADPLIRAQLPGIYGRLIEDANITADLEKFACEPTYYATPWLQDAMHKHASTFSLREPHLTNRIRLAAIRGAELPTPDTGMAVKLAAAGGPTAEYARGYAIFKLAFLAGIPETSTELPSLRTLLMLQS